MDRRYVYPIIVLAAALLLMVFDGRLFNSEKKEKPKERPHKAGPTGDAFLSAATGKLEIIFLRKNGDKTVKLKSVHLRKLRDDAPEGAPLNFEAADTEKWSGDLQPGKYSLSVKVEIDGKEHDLTSEPAEVEILSGRKTTATIPIPPG